MKYLAAFIFTAVLCDANNAIALGPYIVKDLGELGGGKRQSSGRGINEWGQVTGDSSTTGPFLAHLWTPDSPNGNEGAMVSLGSLPGSSSSSGVAINSSGQVVGTSFQGTTHAYLWSPASANGSSGTMVNLGGFLGGDDFSTPYDINSLGQVVGQSSSESAYRAFLWAPNSPNSSTGSMVDLGSLLGQNTDAVRARGINSSGQIVGLSKALDTFGVPTSYAFLWTPSSQNGTTGTMVDIGDLSAGISWSQAVAINDVGQVVGNGTISPSLSSFGNRAFLWTPATANGSDGTMIDLGDLPGGDDLSASSDINSSGQIVGQSSSDAGTRAVIWTRSTASNASMEMYDLNSLAEPTSAAGWNLFAATGINDRGQISGQGRFDPDGPGGVAEVTHGFLLTPIVQQPGDFNFDGAVDAADFVRWRNSDGPASAYDDWRANFGNAIGSSSNADGSRVAAVPEVTAIPSIIAALIACVGFFRRYAR